LFAVTYYNLDDFFPQPSYNVVHLSVTTLKSYPCLPTSYNFSPTASLQLHAVSVCTLDCPF